MRIIIAPDSFKGSNTSLAVAEAIERGIKQALPEAEVFKIPIADGGEGTVDAVVFGGGGEYRKITATGPLGAETEATYGILGEGRAVIEMAAASGLPLVPRDMRNPLHTTTRGTGELIRDALDQGCREILIGIGGSATNDCGVGMAQELGYSFKDASGREIGPGGGEIGKVGSIDTSRADPRLSECTFVVACDVKNPLTGPEGASEVYGPQKGATPEMIKQLDGNLGHLAGIIREQLNKEVEDLPGAGAAGGLGAGLVAFCSAGLRSGIDAVLDIVRFEQQIEKADLIVTGEGRMDGSTAYGKVPVGIASRVRQSGIPVLAIVGDIGNGAGKVYDYGIQGIMSTMNRAMPLEEALSQSTEMLEDAAERVFRIILIGRKLFS